MSQEILYGSIDYKELDEYFVRNDIRSILLVCDDSLQYLRIKEYFEKLEGRSGVRVVKFSGFKSNPLYESVVEGIGVLKENGCDSIVAVGGGSAMDVAKCIKLYNTSTGDGFDGAYLTQATVPNDIKLLVIPTTAGTGSDATRYAVIYYDGKKQSITDDGIIPEAVLFDSSFIATLPKYQKASTAMDALCHAVESFWSVNSTEESKQYSKKVIKLITENIDDYMGGDESKNAIMQEAAYTAGRAINITQTTAGHAMCYGLTSRYGISHGHAAALCVRELWPWMIRKVFHAKSSSCVDNRGTKYLKNSFMELAGCFRSEEPKDGYLEFQNIVDGLELMHPVGDEQDIEELTKTVNPTRLANNPIRLSEDDIRKLYKRIVW